MYTLYMLRLLSMLLLAGAVYTTACNRNTDNPARTQTGAGTDAEAGPVVGTAKLAVTGTRPGVFFDNFEIRGDAVFAAKTKEALALLEGATTFSKISPYIAIIEEAEHSGMVAWTEKPTFQVGRNTWNRGAAWYAGTIAHDGCHSLLYHRAKALGSGAVPAETWTGRQAEQECLSVQAEVLTEIKADKYLVDYVNGLIADPTYQNIPYDKRNW